MVAKTERNAAMAKEYYGGIKDAKQIAKEKGISRARLYQILETQQPPEGYRGRLRGRAYKIYDWIVEFKVANDGNSPTLNELCRQFDTHASTMTRLLNLLAGDGLIVYRPKGAYHTRIDVVGGQYIPPQKTTVVYEEDLLHRCSRCGSDLDIVRPGKYQCPKCE